MRSRRHVSAGRGEQVARTQQRSDSVDQGVGEDLPGQDALGGEAEHDVRGLAAQVVGPLADLAVLQPLVDGERVEEEEDREDDPVDESRWALAALTADVDHDVGGDRDPGADTGHTTEPERCPPRLAIELVAHLHQPAEQDHRGIDEGDADQGGQVGDAGHERDQHDHQGGRDRVLDPAEAVSIAAQLVAIGAEGERRGDQQVEEGGQEQERRRGPRQREPPDLVDGAVGEWCAGGTVEGEGADIELEVVAQDDHQGTRDEMQQAHHQVEDPELAESLIADLDRLAVEVDGRRWCVHGQHFYPDGAQNPTCSSTNATGVLCVPSAVER